MEEETYTPQEMIDFIKNKVIPDFKIRSINKGEYTEYQREAYVTRLIIKMLQNYKDVTKLKKKD